MRETENDELSFQDKMLASLYKSQVLIFNLQFAIFKITLGNFGLQQPVF